MSEVAEIRPLTGLRGMAAVYVVLFHYWTGVGFSSMPRTLLSHGYLAVDLFFVLSGFVMTLNYAELFRERLQWKFMWLFLTRRLARVYPLYVVTLLCAVFLISRGLLQSDSLDVVAFRHMSLSSVIWYFLANLLMIQSWGIGPSFNSPSWSISAEWAAYLLFPCMLWLAQDSGSRRAKLSVMTALFWIAVCCVLPSTITHRPHPESLLNLFMYIGGWPVLRCIPEFFLGIVTARLYTERGALTNILRGRAGDCLLLAMSVLLAMRWSDFFFVALCPALILCLTRNDGLGARLFASRPTRHLGLISYSIYLVHDLLGGLVSLLHRLADVHHIHHGQTYGAIAGIALTYPLSLIAYHLVEKPCRRIMRDFFARSKSLVPPPIGPLGVDSGT